MTWQECFRKYNYRPLITDDMDGKRSLDIVMFLQDGKIPDELRQIYLSNQSDEMFIILQPKPETKVEDYCNKWDNRIMAFINFGAFSNGGRETVHKIRYNITQIVLYGNLPLMQCPDSFSEEKSIFISRKIFIQCSEDDVFNSDSRLLLPFWYEELETVDIPQNQEEKLNSLLPTKSTAEFLCDERTKINRHKQPFEQLNFTKEEFLSVRGWLEK